MSTRLIYGFHAVTAKLRHDPESVKEIVIDATRHDARARDLLAHAELQGVKVIGADGKRLDGMAPGAKHQGVLALIEGDRKLAHLDDVLDTLEEPAFLLVLDGITDPRNLGACLRVADAAGVHARHCAEGQSRRPDRCGGQDRLRGSRNDALRDGDQSGADVARIAGT